MNMYSMKKSYLLRASVFIQKVDPYSQNKGLKYYSPNILKIILRRFGFFSLSYVGFASGVMYIGSSFFRADF